MKRRINLAKVASFVMLLTVTAMILVAGTYAKFTSSGSGTDSVVVASWAFEVNGKNITVLGSDENITFGLFDTILDSDGKTKETDVVSGKIAPGTSGAFEFELFNTSDVTTKYTISLKSDNTSIPIEFSFDGDTWTKDLASLVAEDNMAMGAIDYVTIMWRWSFGDASDADTLIGITPDTSITVSASIKVTQVDSSELAIVNNWENKTAVFVGDSITYGINTTNTYWSYLEDSLSLSSATGMGIAGSAISAKSDYGTSNTPLINRYTTIPDADLITVFMGSNDYGHETPLGTIDDTTDVSFYGALNVIVPALKKAHPNSRIVFITPLHRYGFGTSKLLGTAFTYDYLPNGVGANLEDYANAIKEVCSKYNVPVIDLFTLFKLDPSDADVRNEYMEDGLHPNAAGHQIVANLIANELRKISPIKETSNDTTEESEDISMQLGNQYSAQYLDSTNRISLTKNIYLKAGTIISLNDTTNYKYGVYSANSENVTIVDYTAVLTGGWITDNYTITSDGWYGIAISTSDNSDFDLGGSDPNVLSGYLTFASLNNKTIQIGNGYAGNNLDDTTRASTSENIYLTAGTVVSLKDSSTYAFGVYAQPSATVTVVPGASTQDDLKIVTSGWTTESFTIPSDGYYGIAIKKNDGSDFDLGGSDPNLLTEYLNFN